MARRILLPASGALVIGRAPDVDIQLRSRAASRRHARIEARSEGVWIEDLGSHNGTLVNGGRIRGSTALQAGDIVSVCDATLVLSLLSGDAAGASPTSEGDVRAVGPHQVLVADPVMVRLYGLIDRLAKSELPVLLQGETGTGKELAATALHHFSRRASGPFLAINCATVKDTLAESELFGHKRGAFSGATESRPGLLESAEGGTVFLDEVGELSLPVQAALLRALETKRIRRVGDVKEIPVDVRVVAATLRDLAEEVRRGGFREDLFFRLSVAQVRLPPLRERPRELELLARRFLLEAGVAQGRVPLELGAAALLRLREHGWPGNVRELKNLMMYVTATVQEPVLLPEHVEEKLGRGVAPPSAPASPLGGGSLRAANRHFEREAIAAAIEKAGGNKTQAARDLGIPLRTFMDKVKRHGL